MNFWKFRGIFSDLSDSNAVIEENIFHPLPFRLALDIIGAYFMIEIYPTEENLWNENPKERKLEEEFRNSFRSFYGYFKQDRQRKVFLVFRSIQVNACFNNGFPVNVLKLLPLPQLEHLYLINGVIPLIHSVEDLTFVKYLKRVKFFRSVQIRNPKAIECFRSCKEIEDLSFSVSIDSEEHQFRQNDVIDISNETFSKLKSLKRLIFNLDYLKTDSSVLNLKTDKLSKYLYVKNLKSFLCNIHKCQKLKYFFIKNLSLEKLIIYNRITCNEDPCDECVQYLIDNKNLKYVNIASRVHGDDNNSLFPSFINIYSKSPSELRIYVRNARNLTRVGGILFEYVSRRKKEDDLYLGFENIQRIPDSVCKYLVQPNIQRIKKLFFRRCPVIEGELEETKKMMDDKKLEVSQFKSNLFFSRVDVFDEIT